MKIFRKIYEVKNIFFSFCRVIKIKLLYSNIKINFRSRINKNCDIHCDNNSIIVLENVSLARGVILHAKNGGVIKVSHSYIGYNSIIVSINKITIESNTEIAEMVVIRDQNHNFNFSDTPISKQGYNHSPIIIESNVWIGAKSTVLKGVRIGKSSIIGAHSLVNKSIPNQSLAFGIPAKIK